MGVELLYQYHDDEMTRFAATMDLQLLCCGHADAKDDLEQFHPFRSDPFFRVYRPIRGTLRVMDCDNTTRITPGRYYLFPSEMPFRMLSEGGFTHDWLHFRSSALEHRHLNAVLSCPQTAELDRRWDEFLAEAASHQERPFANVWRSHLLARAVITPFLEMTDGKLATTTGEGRQNLEPALEYVNEFYMRPIQTPELAAMLHMDRNRFSREFRRQFGISPKEHVVNTRIHHAKVMLLTTGMTIGEIAGRCGFNDEYFFYRLFKKKLGMTPCQYRDTMYLGK